jgi:hypothetical protein
MCGGDCRRQASTLCVLRDPSLLLYDSALMLEIAKTIMQTFDIEPMVATMFFSRDFATMMAVAG